MQSELMKRLILSLLSVLFLVLVSIVILAPSKALERFRGLFKQPNELTPHYHQMVTFHSHMDGNVPDDSVIFIGDSLTQGLCVSAVACPSVNYGIGNDTTLGVLQRISQYESIQRAKVVVIAIGINDWRFQTAKE